MAGDQAGKMKMELNELHNSLLRKAAYLASWAIFIMCATIFTYLAPRAEVLMFPVISKFEMTDIEVREDYTLVSGVFIKERGECELLSINFESINTPGLNPERDIKVEFLLNEERRIRPQGANFFGPWKLLPPGPPLGPTLIIETVHRCHIFWNTRDVIFRGFTSDFFNADQIVEPDSWPSSLEQDLENN
jgi:hypothetical protein